jgi:hypothetical protein
VEYSGERYVGILGKQTARADQDTIKTLLQSFERIHFFDQNDRPLAQGCSDGGQIVVSLSVDGKTKHISRDRECVPADSNRLRYRLRFDRMLAGGCFVQVGYAAPDDHQPVKQAA